MLVEFIKERYYKGVLYKPGDFIEMERSYVRSYLNLKVIRISTSPKKINLDNLTYKELQKLCKKHDLAAVGKREDLIISLTDKLS